MTITIEVTGELEVALNTYAAKQGVTADSVACRVLAEALTPTGSQNATSIPELPALQLGAIGNLHRREIYEDAR